jgi:hypothetical protein
VAVGDVRDLPGKVAQTYEIGLFDAFALLELLCLCLNYTIYREPGSPDDIAANVRVPNVSDAARTRIAGAVFAIRSKCLNLCLGTRRPCQRVLYHDWRLTTDVATDSLGRIARPVASTMLRIHTSARGDRLLPPLEIITIELGKHVIDALSSGFDRLQRQPTKIVQ